MTMEMKIYGNVGIMKSSNGFASGYGGNGGGNGSVSISEAGGEGESVGAGGSEIITYPYISMDQPPQRKNHHNNTLIALIIMTLIAASLYMAYSAGALDDIDGYPSSMFIQQGE